MTDGISKCLSTAAPAKIKSALFIFKWPIGWETRCDIVFFWKFYILDCDKIF